MGEVEVGLSSRWQEGKKIDFKGTCPLGRRIAEGHGPRAGLEEPLPCQEHSQLFSRFSPMLNYLKFGPTLRCFNNMSGGGKCRGIVFKRENKKSKFLMLN